MQVTNTNATSTSGIAAGLFGQQNQGTGGLFGLLMSLFGQMGGQTGMPTADGQLVPTGMTGLPQTAPNLPITNILDAASGTEGMPTDAAGLLSWLQNLAANNPAISAQLKSLLAPTAEGAPLDLATFQQRLTGLDEASRDEVMSEIAALMQPIFEKPMAPIAALPDGTNGADATADSAKQPALPAQPALPEAPLAQAPAPQTAAPAAPVAPVAAKPQPTAADKPAEPEAQVATTNSKPRKSAGIRITGPATPVEAPIASEQMADLKAQADKALADKALGDATVSKNNASADRASATAQANSNAGAAMVTSQTAEAKENVNRTPAAGTTDSIKPVASATPDSTAETNLKDAGTDTANPQPQQAVGAQDKTAPVPFADHLQQVKLNRTGAHMPVADQISVQLNRALGEGKDRFTVKLSPGELGRIEIRIEMSAEGQVMASFKVDQPATLDLLQRDQRGLERMLSDAGLKTDGGSLNFNLRDGGQQNGGQHAQNDNGNKGQPGFDLNGNALSEELPAAGIIEATWYVGPDRLNISI